jgi:electron transfer flavoprotein alpha/beta subunit
VRFAVCLHGAAVAHASTPLHPTDRHAIRLARGAGAEVIVLEAVDQRGSAPTAVGQALDLGALRAVRLVDPALGAADAHSTGFALATVIDMLKVDLVLFGADADPEGLPDVPASIAHHMTALFLTGVVGLKMAAAAKAGAPPTAVEAVVENAGWLRRLEVPLNAVIGVDAGRDAGAAVPVSSRAGGTTSATPPPATVQVISLQDLHMEPGLVRRRNDLRGVIEPAPRPLVTLKSSTALAALLRSG